MGALRKYGIVLSGGGARGAYEAGVVHYLRTGLPKPVCARPFHLYCGASVGAVNAAFMASYVDNPRAQGTLLRRAWEQIRQEQIYRRDFGAVGKLLSTSFSGIAMNIFRRTKAETETGGIHFQGLVDTSPFVTFLKQTIPWQRLNANVDQGKIDGISITLTNMQSGRLEFFIHKRDDVAYHGTYPVRYGPIEWQHVMGSAAIPILFPPVEINGVYYADGGLRLNTPMSPAIHMGADRVLVVGMHDPTESADAPLAERKATPNPPALGEIIGKILNSIFLDRLDFDLKQMARINQIIDWGETVYGADFLTTINTMLRERGITGDVASRGLKRLEVCAISPTRDIRHLFADVIAQPGGLGNLSAFDKMILKLLDVDMHRGQDFLSYFLFLPPYLRALTQLGYEDAKAKHDELVEFLSE